MGVGSAPLDDNGKPVLALYNDTTGQVIPLHVGSIVTGADGKSYATLDVDVSVSVETSANQRVNAHAGDFVAGSVADLATLLTLAGASGDANTVNSLMGRLTKVRDLLASFGLDSTDRQKTSIYGKGSGTAGDTSLLLDSSGRPQVVQILGSSGLSDTNPEPNISNIQQMILNGKSYSCSTGLVTAAVNQAASFFIPNTNSKNVIIWSVRVMYSNASQISDFRSLTADDATIAAGTSDAGNAINLRGGGGASSSSFAMHHVSGLAAPAAGAATLPLDEVLNPVNSNAELLSPGMFLYIPPATAGGIAIYTGTTAAGKWAFTVRWTEF